MFCSCKRNGIVEVVGLCDVDNIDISDFQWTQISIPEVLSIPWQKPIVQSIEKIFINVSIFSKRIVNTPTAVTENAEGTRLTGKKLIVEGLLQQKIIYTADEPAQPVHSAEFCFPFSVFIVVDSTATDPNAFCIDVCVEDTFVKLMKSRKIFTNVTLLLNARATGVAC